MDISKFLGDNTYRIVIASALISIINIPIQVTQLILLGKLTFPFISLPIGVPWYVYIFGGIVVGTVVLWIIGYYWEKYDGAKNQNRIANKNNLEISEILERLERIEKRLNERTA